MRIESKFSEEEIKRRINSNIKEVPSGPLAGGGTLFGKVQMIGYISGNTFWIQKMGRHKGYGPQQYFSGKIYTEEGHTIIEGELRYTKRVYIVYLLIYFVAIFAILKTKKYIIGVWLFFVTLGIPFNMAKFSSDDSETMLFIHQIAQAEEF